MYVMNKLSAFGQLAAIATALGGITDDIYSPLSGFRQFNRKPTKTEQTKKTCPQCGTVFDSENRFCSKECFLTMRRKK